jgi:transposase
VPQALKENNCSDSTTGLMNENTFLDYLKQIHRKFPKCYLFLDKAKQQHYRSKKVLRYFADNKEDSLIPVYLPTASPEFMVLEEIWHIAKNDLLVLQYYQSITDFLIKISTYFRTKRFHLDMRNYLVGGE